MLLFQSRLTNPGRWSVLTFLIGLVIVMSSVVSAQDIQSDRAVALEVIAEINEWRMNEGLWPLKTNDTLEEMAFSQAEYLVTETNIPSQGGDFHQGPGGEYPIERSQFPQFDWPGYNNPQQILIGENAGVGTASFVFRYWRGSPTHSRAIRSPDYREIGVAALPGDFGHVIIVVFGGRPNVLPALVDPRDNTIVLSNDSSSFSSQARRWISDADQIQLFDADGRPLTEWVEWQGTIQIPEGAGDKVFVLYSDGDVNTITEVNLVSDAVILPGYIPELEPTLASLPTATSVPLSTNTPEPTDEAVDAAPVVSTNTPQSSAPTSTPELTGAEVLLIYDNLSLTVLNATDGLIDIRGLELTDGETTVPIERWSVTSDVPLDAFPSGGCLQVWSWAETYTPNQPDECRARWSVLNLSPERLFWLAGTFEVRLNGATLATCETGMGRCEVDLPDMP